MEVINIVDPKKQAYKVHCERCNKDIIIYAYPDDVRTYYMGDGGLIQDIFPYLTPGERELLMTGICDDCYERMFNLEDDI